MRSVVRVASAVLILLLAPLVNGVGFRSTPAANSQVGELTPTPLEAFAAKPGAIMVWSEAIGQMESATARATVTAVAFEEPTSTPPIMRGLRLDLAHLQANPDCNRRFPSHVILCARPDAAIFFEAGSLPRVRAGVERGNAEHDLIISFRTRWSGHETVGLMIGGYTFDHWRPEHLIALLDRGAAALRHAPTREPG